MANSDKIIKFEMESVEGTVTDLTPYLNNISFTPEELAPLSFWKHPIEWAKYQLQERRARKYLMTHLEELHKN